MHIYPFRCSTHVLSASILAKAWLAKRAIYYLFATETSKKLSNTRPVVKIGVNFDTATRTLGEWVIV